MNKMQTLAKILLAVLGIYTLLKSLPQLASYFVMFSFNSLGDCSIIGKILMFLWLLLHTAFILVIAYQLLFRGRFWAEKIVGEKFDESQKDVLSLPAAYRLAFVICGILIIFWALSYVPRFFVILYTRFQQGMFHNSSDWLTLLIIMVQLTIGIYLLCGAPHFVRWQVKKSLEIRKKTETSNNAVTE